MRVIPLTSPFWTCVKDNEKWLLSKKKKGPRRGQLGSVLLHALPNGLDLSSPAVEADLLHFSICDSHNSMCTPKQCHCLAAITDTVQKNLQTHTKIHLLRLNPVWRGKSNTLNWGFEYVPRGAEGPCEDEENAVGGRCVLKRSVDWAVSQLLPAATVWLVLFSTCACVIGVKYVFLETPIVLCQLFSMSVTVEIKMKMEF